MTADFASDTAMALAEGRGLIESLMVDTCTITRAGEGKGEFNNETGQYDDSPARVTIYTGKCRIQIKSAVASSSDANAGDRLGTVQQFELQLPVDGTESVSVNDVAEITAAVNDSSLVGRLFTVKARHEKTHATARRLTVIAGTG